MLVSSDLNHDFSGLISYGSGPITVEGTVDGSKLGPFGITLYNFTTAAQSVGINFTNASSGAFSYATNCPASLAAGAVCNYEFYYDPPNGDGCNPSQSGSCTSDSSGYLEGNYEAATWKITSGATLGIGDKGFDRSGAAVFPATLSGKAVLPATNPLSVTPLSYTFGPLAPNELSKTLTIAVTNTSAASLPLTESTEVTPGFTITNNCPNTLAASSSCSFDVTFQSATVGTTSTQIQLGGVGGSTITVNLAGIVSANTGLQLNTVAHNFGSVGTGSSATSFGLSITNNASTAATLSFANSPTGTSPYSVVTSGCPSSLAAGAQCSVIVNFTPTSSGTFSDVLTISSNVPILPDGTGSAGSYSDTVSFTGSGVSGGQFTASSVEHNWGSISLGTAGTNYGVQLTNTTATPLTLNLGGSPFVQGQYGFNLAGTNCSATLAVNASCELIFSFAPTATGQVSAIYLVSAVDTNNNQVPLYSGGNTYSVITLLGTGQ